VRQHHVLDLPRMFHILSGARHHGNRTWEFDNESGAAGGGVFDAARAAVQQRQITNDREPDAGAGYGGPGACYVLVLVPKRAKNRP
jgi:hypothetical protein